jgi:hypothetical protein
MWIKTPLTSQNIKHSIIPGIVYKKALRIRPGQSKGEATTNKGGAQAQQAPAQGQQGSEVCMCMDG